jgi:Plasmid replication region DNA-binding N-term
MTTKPEKADRLQESDVHEVCRQLISAGQKPTVVKLFNQLQRGSMTTIQKFLHTFNDDLTDDGGAVELPTFDVLTDEAVKLSFDVLMAKVYKLANDRAREEFTGERGRLAAEITALTSELVECRDFCESQSGLIESLEKANQELNATRRMSNSKLLLPKPPPPPLRATTAPNWQTWHGQNSKPEPTSSANY